MYSWEDDDALLADETLDSSVYSVDYDDIDFDLLDPDRRNELESLLFAQVHFAAVKGVVNATACSLDDSIDADPSGLSIDSRVLDESLDGGIEEKSAKTNSPSKRQFLVETDAGPLFKKPKLGKKSKADKGEKEAKLELKKNDKNESDKIKKKKIKKETKLDETPKLKSQKNVKLSKKQKKRVESFSLSFLTLDDVLADIPDDGSWAVDVSDRLPKAVRWAARSRYFTPISVVCRNCNAKGHLSKFCEAPRRFDVCYLCGRREHKSSQCPETVCVQCLRKGHSRFYCKFKGSRYSCTRCGVAGHSFYVCPELWRQYHSTRISTKEQDVPDNEDLEESDNPVRRKTPNSCYNCGRSGHLGHECEVVWFRRNSYPNSPYVRYYDKSAVTPRAAATSTPVSRFTSSRPSLSKSLDCVKSLSFNETFDESSFSTDASISFEVDERKRMWREKRKQRRKAKTALKRMEKRRELQIAAMSGAAASSGAATTTSFVDGAYSVEQSQLEVTPTTGGRPSLVDGDCRKVKRKNNVKRRTDLAGKGKSVENLLAEEKLAPRPKIQSATENIIETQNNKINIINQATGSANGNAAEKTPKPPERKTANDCQIESKVKNSESSSKSGKSNAREGTARSQTTKPRKELKRRSNDSGETLLNAKKVKKEKKSATTASCLDAEKRNLRKGNTTVSHGQATPKQTRPRVRRSIAKTNTLSKTPSPSKPSIGIGLASKVSTPSPDISSKTKRKGKEIHPRSQKGTNSEDQQSHRNVDSPIEIKSRRSKRKTKSAASPKLAVQTEVTFPRNFNRSRHPPPCGEVTP